MRPLANHGEAEVSPRAGCVRSEKEKENCVNDFPLDILIWDFYVELMGMRWKFLECFCETMVVNWVIIFTTIAINNRSNITFIFSVLLIRNMVIDVTQYELLVFVYIFNDIRVFQIVLRIFTFLFW